jgi:hypothetical protein
VADIEDQRRPADPRGRDGYTNPAVTEAFLALWRDGAAAPPGPE